MSGVESGTFGAEGWAEPFPGAHGSSFDSTHSTVTRYDIDPDCGFPLHHHPQEQITLVLAGEVVFAAGDETRTLRAGDWAVVGADVPHAATAGPEGATVVGIVTPRRASADQYTVVPE